MELTLDHIEKTLIQRWEDYGEYGGKLVVHPTDYWILMESIKQMNPRRALPDTFGVRLFTEFGDVHISESSRIKRGFPIFEPETA